ncbi:HNH endonuclease [Lyngbya sp. CCAP 1446/10]|uniref:HNH endonuclease n=1 Tax=Lyngbya sp. CCAP 1446/10 TaxID=439293 RepID=UPI002238E0BD|nr:HNH endonuclease [Lyngbya sp. CCAP 1446/10]MCW6052651.1 HNH endonuclease [Lyngbya sp. CCAP 1446/10]
MTIVTVIPGIEGALDLETGCINWQGSRLKNGYGRKWIDGKTVLVHRLVLESKIAGFLDSGYFACHTCDNRSCINPAHLVAGSAAENTGQMMGRDRKTPRRKSIPGIDKLSIQQLREIQTKYLSGTIKNHLAREYGVQHETITKIVQTSIPNNFITVSPRFLGEIQDNGCIIFQGGKDGSGYGRYWKNGKSKSVTRAVLAEKLGYELPTSMDACHTCDTPSCINPEHLWAGTRTQNLLDASQKGRSQGKSHPLSNAKLDWEKVREIRQKLAAGDRMKDVAEAYGVNPATIHTIKYHLTWKEEGEEVPIPRMGGYLDRKLTFAQAQDVRERIKAGESIAKIALEFAVSTSVIYDIKNNVTYKGV